MQLRAPCLPPLLDERAAARVHACEALADEGLEDGVFEAREASFAERPDR